MTAPTLVELVERQLEVAALSGEVESVMRGIVEYLLELPGADGASLSTLENDWAYFRVSLGEDRPLHGQTMRLEDTLARTCASTGELQVLRAPDGEYLGVSLTPAAGAIVLAPIVYDGATRGILGVRSPASDAFSDLDVETVRLLAQSAAVALRNAELVGRLERSEREYRRLHDQAADATLVATTDGELLDANEAAADLFSYSVGELRTMKVRDLLPPDGIAAWPLEREKLAERRELRGTRAFKRRDGSLIDVEYSVRLLDDGRVHAALRDVTDRKREEERLRTNLGRLHAIVETQQAISELEVDHDAVTAAIVERAQRLAGADGAALQMFEGHDSIFRFASGTASTHVGLTLDRGASLAGVAGLQAETVYASDTETDPRVDAEACRRIGVRSLICAPLLRGGRPVGVLAVMARQPEAFDGLAVETTRLMAEFVSSVIRNAEELEARQRLVEELRTQGEVVANMQTALWVWTPAEEGLLRLEYMNAATEEWTGRSAADLTGRTLPEILPGYHEEVVRTLFEVIATGERRDIGEVVYGDERIKTSVLTMKAFPLPGGRVAVTFENVTERVRAHRALQESESRFRSTFDSVSVGMSLNSLDGQFVQANDRLANMLGYSVEELLRMNTAEIIHPEDLETDRTLDAELIAAERSSYRNDLRALRKDGSVVWLRLSVSLAHDYEGKPIHFVAHVEDITDLKDAEAFFESVFERSVVPKVIIDDERLVVDVNEAAAELLGVPHDETVGLNLDGFFPDLPVGRYWQRFLESGTMRAEATLRRPDGAEREIEFVGTANVQPGRHIAVALDLTAQKALEQQLQQAQKMEAVGRLAGGIAHDFNNLLTAITGYSEFLIAGIDEDSLRLHAEEIRRAAARAASLTGQLLAFSRRQVLQPRVLSLNAIVTDMDMMLRRLIGEDVELVTVLDPDLGPVRADPTQIEQVIVNLAVNARDAMPNGGALRIETANVATESGDVVEFRLTDTGTGMTPQQRQRLFDPFFTTKEGGTGLGLATVYGIVEQSGGVIDVESELGLGTSFRIHLPRVLEPLEQPTVVPHDGSRPDVGTETILLVEDEAIVRQLVGEMLTRNGYTVLQAGDGPSALELLRRHSDPVDLLITDVVMPGMSGRDVANAVTSMRPGILVLYTSGYTDSVIGQHGVLEPGIAFLQKPFSVGDLISKVRGLLDAV